MSYSSDCSTRGQSGHHCALFSVLEGDHRALLMVAMVLAKKLVIELMKSSSTASLLRYFTPWEEIRFIQCFLWPICSFIPVVQLLTMLSHHCNLAIRCICYGKFSFSNVTEFVILCYLFCSYIHKKHWFWLIWAMSLSGLVAVMEMISVPVIGENTLAILMDNDW